MNFTFFVSAMKFINVAAEKQDLVWTLDPIGKNVSKRYLLRWKPSWIIETKLPRNDHWKVLYKFSNFYADRTFQWWPFTAGHRLTLDPMGKYSNAFFSENYSIWLKPNMYMNVPLDGPLQTLRFLFRYEIQNGGYGRT